MQIKLYRQAISVFHCGVYVHFEKFFELKKFLIRYFEKTWLHLKKAAENLAHTPYVVVNDRRAKTLLYREMFSSRIYYTISPSNDLLHWTCILWPRFSSYSLLILSNWSRYCNHKACWLICLACLHSSGLLFFLW